MNNTRQFDVLDLLTIMGFVIGYLNYSENVDQTSMQEAINGAMSKLQAHLELQDNKIDEILRKLGDVD